VSDPEAQVKACYATWRDSYYEDYYGGKAPYPPVHRDLIVDLLRKARARRVLDAGCGPASILRHLAAAKLDVYGFDLTPEMVAAAREVLAGYGVPAARVWEGSVLRRASFRPRGAKRPVRFDAAICVGVMPHIPATADVTLLRHLTGAVRPGGLVVVEARNQLFSLFTLNRYSFDFFVTELIRAGDDGEIRDAVAAVREQLESRFRMDVPPRRRGKAGEPGYDEVLSRTHNPLVLREQARQVGLRDVRVLFYHYHCLPPMFEARMPELFRRRSLAMERPDDWRGHFMASAFLLVGRRP
jgi:SAM-dependent methyltransferase